MKPVLTVSVAALTLATAAGAHAQGVDAMGAYGGADRFDSESPQNFAFELRFGRYVPNVDDEFAGPGGPYESTFGNGFRFHFGAELDWQALRIPKVGTLGPGVGFGFTKASAKARTAATGERSGQGTALRIFPLYAVGVFRVDVLAREASIPLVPYAKAGFGYALWWTKSGGRPARDDAGVRGRDVSYGYQFALGGMFLLDVLDQDAAVEMDANTGVNNSYLFAEWYFADLDGFGSGKMQVGTSTWILGLALEI